MIMIHYARKYTTELWIAGRDNVLVRNDSIVNFLSLWVYCTQFNLIEVWSYERPETSKMTPKNVSG